jgi:hypothetical protein
MRILDADILAYALYDESPAHSSAWQIIEKGLKQEIGLNLTHTHNDPGNLQHTILVLPGEAAKKPSQEALLRH